MLRNAEYIYNNIIIADEVNTTKSFCKKAQVGVDLTIKSIQAFEDAGAVLSNKTYAPNRIDIRPGAQQYEGITFWGWFIEPGTYNLTLNEGCQFGPNDTGKVIMRSSLNRCGVSVESAIWDPEYTTQSGDVINNMNLRLVVENPNGVYIEQNARVAQLLIMENENTTAYNGQWQGGRTTSKLI